MTDCPDSEIPNVVSLVLLDEQGRVVEKSLMLWLGTEYSTAELGRGVMDAVRRAQDRRLGQVAA